MRPDLPLDQIADAILDGAPVDWSVIESNDSNDATGVRDLALVEQLKTLETLRRRRRSTAVAAAAGTWTWGPLQVLERIGHGAYGDVYRAWDTRLDREVALKLLPSDAPAAGLSQSTIIEEGRLLARVRHPNVVTIYGAERIDGRVGLWMELVKGRTLEEALREGRSFSADEVARLGVALCHAVSAVHAAGLLHRDIKAQNVMLDDTGRLVLMDFGTGRELDTTGGQIAGTPLYLAPEVLSGSEATPQSDVYSIGVVLFRLLTKTYPVTARDMTALRQAHADRRAAAALIDHPEVPKRLRRVIDCAIDPEPTRRHASADAFAEALTAAQGTSARRHAPYYIAAVTIAVIALAWIGFGRGDLVGPKLSAVAEGATIEAPVIAVMPFKNLSAEPGSEHFVDGLTSEVIRNLSDIDGLQVKSTTSSFWFKGRPQSLALITQKLPGVNLVVEADVLRIGNRLRINAQVVRVAGDVPILSKQFNKTIDDVYDVQDEISRVIVNQLRLTLNKGQRRYRTSPQAWDLYYRALGLRAGKSDERAAEAIQLFLQAIEEDKNFAPAYAGLATVYQSIGWNLGTSDWAGMGAAARKAFDLDPMLPEAVAAMGLTYAYERDWDNAITSFDRALALNPNLSLTYTSYSDALVLMEQPKHALRLLEHARAIDPLSLPVQRDLGFAQFLNGHYEQAITNLLQIVGDNPEFMSDLLPTRFLMMAGRADEAIALWKSRPSKNAAWERWLARAYAMKGQPEEVARVLAAQKTAWHQAIVYAGIGDKNRTFEALEKAAKDPEWANRVVSALFAPEFEFLRGDPRRDALKRELKLPVER